MFFGCEVGAKSSTLAAMIPLAEASGHCEIRDRSAVFRIETDAAGRASEVLYYDKDGKEQAQMAKAVIVSANGAETSRLLLLSASERHPDGLANSSGFVGRNLMFNAHSAVDGVFEHPLNDYTKQTRHAAFMVVAALTRVHCGRQRLYSTRYWVCRTMYPGGVPNGRPKSRIILHDR
jgi:choline dehydrogenase-like flavoprotein